MQEATAPETNSITITGQGVTIGPKLSWELESEEIIFPFLLQVGAKDAPLFVHMRPYRAEDLKQYLTETAPSVKLEDDETSEIVRNKPERTAIFFWKHFKRLSVNGDSASECDLAKQRQWILDHPRFDLPNKAVLDGFGGIATKREPQPDEETANGNGTALAPVDIFSIDLEPTTSVPLTQRLYLPAAAQIVALEMQHNFRRETAAEYQRYERATERQLVHRKRQAYQRTTNHSVIEQLYNSLIESVDGMTIKGAPCAAANKDQWLELVPYWHKHLALTDFFSGIQSKNG